MRREAGVPVSATFGGANVEGRFRDIMALVPFGEADDPMELAVCTP